MLRGKPIVIFLEIDTSIFDENKVDMSHAELHLSYCSVSDFDLASTSDGLNHLLFTYLTEYTVYV